MIRTTSVIMLVVLLAVFLTSVVAAQSQVVVIHPFRDRGKVITVYSDQVVVIRHGWAAASPGLVQSYINAVNQEYTLNGMPLFTSSKEARQYWGPIQPLPDIPPEGACPGHTPISVSHWEYRLSNLQPGDYVLHTLHWVDRPLIDGCDSDGDGSMDHIRDWRIEGTLTIRVVQ